MMKVKNTGFRITIDDAIRITNEHNIITTTAVVPILCAAAV